MNKLHIGYHKTGTTFLQQLIFPHIPNYEGRIYAPTPMKPGMCNFNKFGVKGKPLKTCKKIINHFNKEDDIFISHEVFSKIPHNELFELVSGWDVLLVSRNFEDLVHSRRRHEAPDFFLQDKISNGNFDREVKDFYNPQIIAAGVPNLTVLSYEKLFAGEKSEIGRLSEYVGIDIESLFFQHIGTKVNEFRPLPRRRKRRRK